MTTSIMLSLTLVMSVLMSNVLRSTTSVSLHDGMVSVLRFDLSNPTVYVARRYVLER